MQIEYSGKRVAIETRRESFHDGTDIIVNVARIHTHTYTDPRFYPMLPLYIYIEFHFPRSCAIAVAIAIAIAIHRVNE